MPIKVLYTLDSLNRGGAEMLALDVCRNASSAGLDITFVATGGGDLEPEFISSGVEYLRFQRKLPIDLGLVRRLRRIIKKRGIEVVHAQQSVEAIHIYLATRGTSAKCVMTLHNRLMDKKNRLAAGFILPRMDAIFSVSESMQEWYRVHEGFSITGRYHVLLNGVDAARLAPTRANGAATLHEELGIDKDAALLGMIGNFYEDARKDQLTVCRALPKFFERFPGAHFVFVGSVHDGAEAYHRRCVELCRESGIADRVHFAGLRSDIPDVLRELSLFIFSSVQEGLPIAAVEALLLGVPMIVSDIPPLLEVIGAATPDGPCAEIFRTGDADELAEKLIELLADTSRLAALGEKARVQTPKYFSIEAHLRELSRLYGRVISGSS